MYTYTSLYLDIKMYSRKSIFEVGHKYPIVWFNIVTPRRSSKTFPTPPVRDPSLGMYQTSYIISMLCYFVV